MAFQRLGGGEKVEKGSVHILNMEKSYGFDFDGFLKRIEPAYRAVKGLPEDLRGFGEGYLDLLGASILAEAFVQDVRMPALCTDTLGKEKLGKVMDAIGGEDGLVNYICGWVGLKDAISLNTEPYDLVRQALFRVEEMKGINDPAKCVGYMDRNAEGRKLSERDRANKN